MAETVNNGAGLSQEGNDIPPMVGDSLGDGSLQVLQVAAADNQGRILVSIERESGETEDVRWYPSGVFRALTGGWVRGLPPPASYGAAPRFTSVTGKEAASERIKETRLKLRDSVVQALIALVTRKGKEVDNDFVQALQSFDLPEQIAPEDALGYMLGALMASTLGNKAGVGAEGRLLLQFVGEAAGLLERKGVELPQLGAGSSQTFVFSDEALARLSGLAEEQGERRGLDVPRVVEVVGE